MKVLQAKLISSVPGRSIIELTCEINHTFLARWLWKVPKREVEVVYYVGSGTVWRLLETYERVSSALEAKLADMEQSLLANRATWRRAS